MKRKKQNRIWIIDERCRKIGWCKYDPNKIGDWYDKKQMMSRRAKKLTQKHNKFFGLIT